MTWARLFTTCLGVALGLLVALPAAGDGRGGAGGLELTLDDAIELALRNNRSLRRARLGRETDRFALEVAEDRYRPRVIFSASARETNRRPAAGELTVGPSLRVPTGGELVLRWSEALAGGNGEDRSWTLGFSQPILRGFGSGIDTAPVRIARIRERINVLSFRETVAGVVDSVVRAYRRVIREHRALAISRDSLDRSRKQLRINRSLIRVGRLAERDIVRNEAEIATRELALVESENDLMSANAGLVSILDVDEATRILPVDTSLAVEALQPDLEYSIAIAFANRPDYLRAQLVREVAATSVRVAENDQRWDVDLTASVSRGDVVGHDYGVAVELSVPLGDRSDDLSLLRARTGLRDTEISLVELEQSIRIAVRQAVHGVKVGLRRIELARRARELAQQQLDIERRKLEQGLSSAYQLTVVEDDLVRAQNVELDSVISYLDAVTSLDRTLGTTLQSRGIDVAETEFDSAGPESGMPVRAAGSGRRREPVSAPAGQGVAAAAGGRHGPQPLRLAKDAEGRAGPRAGARAPAGRVLRMSLSEFESVPAIRGHVLARDPDSFERAPGR